MAGNPIVVINGSGMAADILAYAYTFLHSGLYMRPFGSILKLLQLGANTQHIPSVWWSA